MPFILVYITHSTQENADKLAKYLLEKKMIACANTFPIKSIYWWKGSIQNEDEVVTLVKTRKGNWEKLKQEVKNVHPYECPCIMKLDVEANSEYEDWIEKETKN